MGRKCGDRAEDLEVNIIDQLLTGRAVDEQVNADSMTRVD
jgi:hypothetical protein